MGGFYEPHVNEDGSRDQFFLHLADREVFGVAGLWDRSRRNDGAWIQSCVLITVPANRLLAGIHNEKQRMPAILAEEDHEAWLFGAKPEARAALKPYADDLTVGWKVSRRVNNPRLPNDASLIEPLGS
jgi:putative SOS response-associated peptidase YedK